MEVCTRMDLGVACIGGHSREDRALTASSVHHPTLSGTKRPHDSCSNLDNPCARATPTQSQREPRGGEQNPLCKRARLECPPWSCADKDAGYAMDDPRDDPRVLSASPIAWLSDEIRLHIARYCSLVDLGRLACVSRDWCRVASDPHLCARTYDLHVGRCRFDHLCHGVTTDAVSDPAFFAGGLAALGVPHSANASETNNCPTMRDGDVPTAPEAIPSWAADIGRALAECCARIARSAAETRGRGTLYEDPSPTAGCSGDGGGLLQTCRHVPPTFIKAFGVGAAYRASIVGPSDAYAGPRFWYEPADADSQPRRALIYERPMGAYMWPCRISALPPRHTACLYTDGPRYSFETDVALALMLADADGRTVWAHAWSRSSTDVTADNVAWYCAGPFPRREPLHMDLADDTSEDDQDSNRPARVSRARPPINQTPLVVCRRFDGTVACARAGRRVNRKTGVRYILHDAVGPCLMETAGSRTIYRGGLAMGVRSGHGIVRTADGVTIYDGLWSNDLPAGEGKLYDIAGRLVFSGTFRDGAPGAGPGLLCVPPTSPASSGNVRPCKVYGSAWETLMPGSEVIYATPRGDGHITLADGTRLDCHWSHPRQPPSVLRVHVSARSALSLDGRPCVLDLTVAPPSFYDDALALLEDDRGGDDDGDEVVPIRAKRAKGAKAVAVHVEGRHRLDCVSAWRERVPSQLVATCPSQPRGTVAEPCEWIVHALAGPSLSFAVDLAPHRPGRLVVDLLGAPRQT